MLDGRVHRGESHELRPIAGLGSRDESDFYDRYSGPAHLGLVIRVYRQTSDPYTYVDDWEQMHPDVFHRGDAGQELASLVSLALSIRLRAGGIARAFDVDGDPRGYPYSPEQPLAYLPPRRERAMLRDIVRVSVELDIAVPLLHHYPLLTGEQAVALVQAARSYQEALWIAETDPRQAWLRLVWGRRSRITDLASRPADGVD